MRVLIALLAGSLFGVGLAVSGMTDTRVVLGFLDLAGDWNPALMFVMGGALAITVPGFYLLLRKCKPLLCDDYCLPEKRRPDIKLVIGSTLFGIGWGLYGYCPGPAMASLGTLEPQPIVFVLAMLAGMFAHRLFEAR